jgi:hypothetical protein
MSYSMVAIQMFNNRVELAWAGLNECYKNVNVHLRHDFESEKNTIKIKCK